MERLVMFFLVRRCLISINKFLLFHAAKFGLIFSQSQDLKLYFQRVPLCIVYVNNGTLAKDGLQPLVYTSLNTWVFSINPCEF